MPKDNKTTKTKKTAAKPVAKIAPVKALKPEKTAPKAKPVPMAKPAPKKEAPSEKPKSKVSFKKEITQKLLTAKTRILQEVSQKVKTESDVHKFEIGDIYDIASTERERELTLMLGDREREKLSEIEDALERVGDNSYGGCEECGEPIAEDRLRALPFTRVCVECQFKHEREQKIRGRHYDEDTGLGIMEKSEEEEEY